MKYSRTANRLTALKVKNAKVVDRLLDNGELNATTTLSDGGGLNLLIDRSGAKRWLLRVAGPDGKRLDRGLGSYPEVTLEAARQAAGAMRQAVKSGVDPKAAAREQDRLGVTFRQAFETYFENKRLQLSNAKHMAQWANTMHAYVFPAIGHRLVDDIRAADIDAILKPIWHDKPETASRVLQRLNSVFEDAIRLEHRTRASPTIGVAKALGVAHRKVEHHRAMPYADVPAFARQLRHGNLRRSITRMVLEFVILTACRSGEARWATWGEFDLQAATWTIPAERIKMRREHVVPLGPRSLEVLVEARALRPQALLVFPSRKLEKPLSDMTLTKLLRDLKLADVATVHGFRSSFKDWSAEVARVRDEVSEACLAHAVEGKVKAAYLRADFLGERRELMLAWEKYLCSVSVGGVANAPAGKSKQ